MLILVFFWANTALSVPPETEITNVARATYSLGNLKGLTSESNIVTVITVDDRTPSALEFLRYAPDNSAATLVQVSTTYYSSSGLPSGPFEPLAPPREASGESDIDINQPVPLISSAQFMIGEPIFIQLADIDQNLDSLISETVLINLFLPENGESELLRLSETEPNTGIFTGYIQSDFGLAAAAFNGAVAAQEGHRLQGAYSDILDSLDVSSDTLTFVMEGTSLFINKSASKSIVSAGDYLQYSLKIENTSTVTLDNISIKDNLPYSTRYQPGSTTFNDVSGGDPQISADGRLLTFIAGALAPGESLEIKYVVKVGPTAKPGELTNSAYAADITGQISNTATATVRVREELFTNESFIAGRVFIGECDTSSASHAGEGIPGVRIYLEDGTYAVTDSNGMYHFEAIAPGVHVLQLDRDGLPAQYEVFSCKENSRTAGNAYSKFVDQQAGNLWQADFEVRLRPREAGELKLELSSKLDSTLIHYRIDLKRSVVPLRNLRLVVMLPEQLEYLKGSCRVTKYPVEDPSISGRTLTFALSDMQNHPSKTITFDAALCPFDTTAELRTKCFMMFDTPESTHQKTQIVSNSLTILAHEEHIPSTPIMLSPYFPSFKVELDSLMKQNLDAVIDRYKGSRIQHIYITGHSDSSKINPRSRSIYSDNYALSLARAKTVAEYLANRLLLDSSQLTVTGVGPDEPVAEDVILGRDDLNRRVDIKVIAEKITRYRLLDIAQGKDGVSTDIFGLRPGESLEVLEHPKDSSESFADLIQRWLDEEKPGFEWLWPAADHNPPIPSLKIAIKHDPDHTPRLLLDGDEVPSLNFSETVIGQSDSVAISIWTGIDLHEGTNDFAAVLHDAYGRDSILSRLIHYSGPPVGIEIIDSLSRLVANGREPAIIAVRFTDANGYPARPGVSGEWSVDPPYMAQQEVEDLRANPLLRMAGQKPKYLIGKNGIALLALQPSSRSGEALLKFHLLDREEEVRVWLRPAFRNWLVVGLAEGTVGYNTSSGSRQNIADADADDKAYSRGRTSFLARGEIAGDRMLTVAIDSKRWNSDPDSNMFRTVNPQSFYPLYGDGMEQGYDVSSSRGIYAKVEAANYYALFGDFNTGLNVTELSRYNRAFNGLKFEDHNEKQNLNLFLSRANQSFVRDEIQADGTSGPYHLSHRNIVVNSERVVIETRDRFQNDVILSRQRMRQFLDYNIDYYSGVIYFKRPMPSRDDQFNPLFITTDYESNDVNNRSYNYGGRAGMNLTEHNLNVGATYVREGRIGGYGRLGGMDATLALGSGLQLKTEFAASKVKEGIDHTSGNAYLVELERNMKKLSGIIFIRNQDPQFGLGQLNLNERGTRKFGTQAVYRLHESLVLRGQAYRQSYLLTDSRRDFGEIKINKSDKRLAAQGGIRYAEDHLADGTVNRSCQLMAGGSYKVWADRLELRLMHEQSIIKNDNPDFPTRTTLGADYHFNRHLTFFAQQDFANGSKLTANDTRIGFKTNPWKGARFYSDIERNYRENAQRVFSNIGLIQALQINDKLGLDFSLDHGELISSDGELYPDSNLVPASGSPDDFTAVSLGASYREKMWSSAARIEFRDSKIENKFGIVANLFGEPRDGLGLLMSSRINRNHATSGLRKIDGDIRFGLVYRPVRTKWLALNRLDFIFSTQKGGEFDYDNWRLVDNLSMNCRFSNRISVAFQYGAKYMREMVAASKYRGYMDFIGLESRYDLNSEWDVGARLSLLHSWNLGQYQYGSGISIGYSFIKNVWASLGYNFSGFYDRDFSDGNFTVQGPFLQIRFKFDNMSIRDIAGHLGF